MAQKSENQAGSRARRALGKALKDSRPGISLNGSGYTRCFLDNLLPYVWRENFEEDLHEGDGNELSGKFCAPHSSAALAVNCFAPFRRKLGDLPNLPGECKAFDSMRFEAKCETGVSKRRRPNLDVLLCGSSGVLGIESKFTEHCGKRSMKKDLSSAGTYTKKIHDERREQGYFKEMERLMEAVRLEKENDTYKWLDAAQLIKHAFGLAYKYQGRSVTLLYLYWEPKNWVNVQPFKEHRDEIKIFSDNIKAVKDSTPAFISKSYPELWAEWRDTATGWVSEHLDNLEERYRVDI